jgi:hypothetical protein
MNNTKNKDAFTDLMRAAEQAQPSKTSGSQQVTSNSGEAIKLGQGEYKIS